VLIATISNMVEECNTGRPPEITDLRNSACADIHDYDEVAAFNATIDSGDLTAWTFGVNFDVLNANGDPLGCLRVYARDEANHRFTPVDGGGILVDTCSSTSAPSISATGQDNSAGFPSNMATFDGTQSVVCQMDLATWLTHSLLSDFAALLWDFPMLLSGTILDSTPGDLIQLYANLSLVTRPRWPNPVFCDPATHVDDACLQPLMQVLPSDPNAPAHTLEVFVEGTEFFRFWSRLVCPIDRGWGWNQAWSMVWRFTPSFTPQGDSSLLDLEFMSDPPGFDSSCYAVDLSEKVPYYLGLTDLWIGFAPHEQIGLQGDLDGVLIDPSDSKPPS
jgi:hypothetical protein